MSDNMLGYKDDTDVYKLGVLASLFLYDLIDILE